MNFSTDRDLLVLEPSIFHDMPFIAQQRIRATDAAITGVTLSSASSNFTTAQIGAGSVVLVANQAFEVLARIDDHTLTISMPRNAAADGAIPSTITGTNQALVARTFAPQAALVADTLLRMIGLDPDDPRRHDTIVSVGTMSMLEALGTLERIYSAATAVNQTDVSIRFKAADYRKRFGAACRSARVLIDTDHDGLGDVTRQPGVANLTRV